MTALRSELRCAARAGAGLLSSLTLEPSPSLHLQEGRMEPGVLGSHRRPGGGEGLRQAQAAGGGPHSPPGGPAECLQLRTSAAWSLPGAPVWSRVCRRKWGSSAESGSPPRAHQGAPCPRSGALARPGGARPQRCSRKSRLSPRLRPISRRLQFLRPPIFKASLPGRQHGGLAPRSGLPVPLHQKAAGASLPRGGRVPGTSS